MPRKLYGLDHLRTIAILYVFLFHYFILSSGEPSWLPGLAGFGWTGVDLFFVLSGFLIAAQLFEPLKNGIAISWRSFFIKRFFRIVPAYLVTVAIYYCLPFFREKEHLPPLWKFLTFTQNFGLNLKDYGTFSHAWSLCVEEHFYFFLPLILLLLHTFGVIRKGYWLLVMLFVAGFFIRRYCYQDFYLPHINADDSWRYWYEYIYYPTYTRLDGLLVGVSIAALYQFHPGMWARVACLGNYLLLSGVLVLTGAWFLCEDPQTLNASVWGFPVVALGYGLIVMGAVADTSFLYRWNSKVTGMIAKLSYAVYLTHKGVIHLTHDILEPYHLNSNLLLLISMITCLLAAGLLHVAVERPFMQLRSRIAG